MMCAHVHTHTHTCTHTHIHTVHTLYELVSCSLAEKVAGVGNHVGVLPAHEHGCGEEREHVPRVAPEGIRAANCRRGARKEVDVQGKAAARVVSPQRACNNASPICHPIRTNNRKNKEERDDTEGSEGGL